MPKSKNRKVSDNADVKSKSEDKAMTSSDDKSEEVKDGSASVKETAKADAAVDPTGEAAAKKEESSGPAKETSSAKNGGGDDAVASKIKSDEKNAADKKVDKKDAPKASTKTKSNADGNVKSKSSPEKTDTSCATKNDVKSANKNDNNQVDIGMKQKKKADIPSKTSNNNPSRALNPSSNSNQTNTSPEIPTSVTTSSAIPSNATQPTNQTHATAQNTAQASSNNNMDCFDDDYSDSKDTLLTMTFNQDGGCLAVGTGSGFRICNVNPFQETFRRNIGGGSVEGGGTGIAHVEMLYRTNLLALTGHSTSPQYPPNKVLIYDDHLQQPIGELSFRQKVLTTKLRRDRIVVVLRDRVYIYNFSDLALLDKVHTGDNPLGLIGISMDNGGVGGSTTSVERAEDALGSGGSAQRNNGMVLACPSTQRGQVRVELYGLRRTTFVDAHESALGALTLSVDGSLLATASERGTVIRLFDTRGVTIGGGSSGAGGSAKNLETTSVSSSVPLREFRRGVERATISCLTFSLDSNWLGCASDHGTVHIFQTQDPHNNNATEKKSRSSSMTGKALRMLPKLVTAPKKYLMDGVHSYAQVRGVPHPQACAFVPDREQTIAVAGSDEYGNGCLLLAEFGKPSSGDGYEGFAESKMDDSEARRLGYHRFFKCKSPASQTGSRRRTKSRDKIADDAIEGGAYIDDAPVDMRMNHISIGDENEDDFVPIDYNEEK